MIDWLIEWTIAIENKFHRIETYTEFITNASDDDILDDLF